MQSVETIRADVLVLGAGGAGVMAAVEAERAGATTIIVSKEPVGYGDTRISLGAMSTSPDRGAGDSEEAFAEDMMRGGEHLSDPKLVDALVRDAMDATVSFEGFGHLFARDESGTLKRLEFPPGGHRASRTITSPGVGVSMGHVLRAAAARSSVRVLEETVCSELIVADGQVAGAATLRMSTGKVVAILAKSTILATGGAGALYYPHTDCMPAVAGDGFSLALRAGAELVDMEQVQFIPFGITHPASMLGAPCGEPAMAGPFGRLVDCRGEVVLENIMPLTRAQVARVIVEQIRRGGATGHGGLLLDLRPNLETPDGRFFADLMKKMGGPFLDVVRKAYGRKAANLEEPWDVLPSAHYNMGGVRTDAWCRAGVPGLYACGQAQGGVMGGNRLGSTSLTEIFVFGKRAGRTAAREGASRSFADPASARPAAARLRSLPGSAGAHRPVQLKRELQQLMWEKAGPLRDAAGLTEALERMRGIRERSADLRLTHMRRYNTEAADAIELDHMLRAAEAIARSALERKESRGAHVRSDFPRRNDQAPVENMLVRVKNGACQVGRKEAGR
ncbi:MAG: FAD-binding protein [bacterium]